ncbi:hypothetical protein CRG98_013723 [Punica granatum]|uniref:Uncharacterized protein n=1 Tax=Punica granatum TaxID=22663 RepID=A0A2I0KCS2_PUNGR|nr:hypothetical protein CRG98_013723 [Punica granatum]
MDIGACLLASHGSFFNRESIDGGNENVVGSIRSIREPHAVPSTLGAHEAQSYDRATLPTSQLGTGRPDISTTRPNPKNPGPHSTTSKPPLGLQAGVAQPGELCISSLLI